MLITYCFDGGNAHARSTALKKLQGFTEALFRNYTEASKFVTTGCRCVWVNLDFGASFVPLQGRNLGEVEEHNAQGSSWTIPWLYGAAPASPSDAGRQSGFSTTAAISAI